MLLYLCRCCLCPLHSMAVCRYQSPGLDPDWPEKPNTHLLNSEPHQNVNWKQTLCPINSVHAITFFWAVHFCQVVLHRRWEAVNKTLVTIPVIAYSMADTYTMRVGCCCSCITCPYITYCATMLTNYAPASAPAALQFILDFPFQSLTFRFAC